MEELIWFGSYIILTIIFITILYVDHRYYQRKYEGYSTWVPWRRGHKIPENALKLEGSILRASLRRDGLTEIIIDPGGVELNRKHMLFEDMRLIRWLPKKYDRVTLTFSREKVRKGTETRLWWIELGVTLDVKEILADAEKIFKSSQ